MRLNLKQILGFPLKQKMRKVSFPFNQGTFMNIRKGLYPVLLSVLLPLSFCTQSGAKTITLESLLDEMVSVEESARYPEPFYTCRQESSYDRRSVSPDKPGWFANDDGWGVIRVDEKDGRKEKVLFDEVGPGVITRIWITTLDKRGTWRFYFDGSDKPDWIIPAYDLMRIGIPFLGRGLLQPHTSYSPEGKGGNTLFLPIPYAKSCKITFEDEPGVNPTPKYYHVNFRKYPKGTMIETFSKAVINRAKDKIAAVDKLLLSPPQKKADSLSAGKQLNAKETLRLELPKGEYGVYRVTFKIKGADPEQYAQIMREIIFQAKFDGKDTVWVPLSDFSGGGMGAPEVQSWFLTADGKGTVESRWLMPYKQSGTLMLKNLNDQAVDVSMDATVSTLLWDERMLYFHSSWRQERGIPIYKWDEGELCKDWNFATIQGKGVYKGDLLSLFNHAPAWYGEGDEKIWVDDDIFPSHFGTGTEDYYNSSWAPVVPFHTPFGGAPRADMDSSHGYNAFFRTRNLDGIPFGKSFRFDIEMMGWQRGTVDYATTIYWYGDYAAKAIGTSGEDEATRALVPVPPNPVTYKIEKDSLEFEDLKPVDVSPSIHTERQRMLDFADGKWGKAYQFLGKDCKLGDHVTFEFENLENRPYALTVYATKASDYGILSFTVNGKDTGVTFDGYSVNVVNSGPIALGSFTPVNGKITLKISIAGSNEKAVDGRYGKYLFGLDCITLR